MNPPRLFLFFPFHANPDELFPVEFLGFPVLCEWYGVFSFVTDRDGAFFFSARFFFFFFRFPALAFVFFPAFSRRQRAGPSFLEERNLAQFKALGEDEIRSSVLLNSERNALLLLFKGSPWIPHPSDRKGISPRALLNTFLAANSPFFFPPGVGRAARRFFSFSGARFLLWRSVHMSVPRTSWSLPFF